MQISERIGLIAGNGKFPLLLAKSAAEKGIKIICLAIKGDTNKKIAKYVDEIYWFRVREFSKMIEKMKTLGLKNIVMAGQINPFHLLTGEVFMDIELSKLIKQLKDRRADTIFSAVVQRIEDEGMEVLPSHAYMGDYIPPVGVFSKEKPTEDEWQDFFFGKAIAKDIGRLDIGQTVVVKGKSVLAVEAFEGTNRCIIRGGFLAKGALVVKMSKPDQDMRFDVPVVGVNTIRAISYAGCRGIAIEAGKTIVIDRERVLRAVDRLGMLFVAIQG